MLALQYLERGLSVIPLYWVEGGRCGCGSAHESDPENVGKHPIIRWAEFQQRRPTPEEVTSWWGRYPKANIGVITGAVSGIVVLDIDPRHGGDESVRDLPLPPTVTAITGGGGYHLYYQHPGVPVPSRVGVLPGIDVRGDGGYVVAPPSTHRSGRQYAWEVGYSLWEHHIATLPPEVLAIIRRGGEPGQDFDLQSLLARGIPEGERNVRLAQIAGHYFGKGYDYRTVLRRCLEINRRYCLPPLGADEVVEVVDSIWRQEQEKQQTVQIGNKTDRHEQVRVVLEAMGLNLDGLVDILRYRDRVRDKVHYVLRVGDEEFTLGSDLLNQASVRRSVMEALGILLPRRKPQQWDVIAHALRQVAAEVNVTPQAREEATEWVMSYLAGFPPVEAEDGEARYEYYTRGVPFLYGGYLWLRISGLLGHVHSMFDYTITPAMLQELLRRSGWERASIRLGDHGTRYLWRHEWPLGG